MSRRAASPPPARPALAKCGSCHTEILWSTMHPSGKRNPLDYEPLELEAILDPARGVKIGIIGFREETGRAMMVSAENLDNMARWHQDGLVTFHVSHFATCPNRDQHRRG